MYYLLYQIEMKVLQYFERVKLKCSFNEQKLFMIAKTIISLRVLNFNELYFKDNYLNLKNILKLSFIELL